MSSNKGLDSAKQFTLPLYRPREKTSAERTVVFLPILAARVFGWRGTAQLWWLHHVAVLLQLVLVLLLLG